jgi:predicted Zn-dependent protease
MTRARRVATAVALAWLLAACGSQVVNPVTGRTERSVMDEKTELAEGRKAHAEVLKEYGALADPRLQAYVNDIGQRLARNSHRAQIGWTFTVLDSPEVNAFALPGGYVYITRGIMAYLDSEAELAGVLGHEIGHVTARHGAQRATRQQNAGLGVLAAAVLGAVLEAKGVGGAAEGLAQVGQSVAAGTIASYSREQESEADRLGAEYLSRTQYDPQNMVDVIGVLRDQERYAADTARAEGRAVQAGGNWLASHPSNDKRLADIRQTAAAYKGSYQDDGRARYLQAIDGIVFGESRGQGVTRGRFFLHEELEIALTAPQGWRVQNDQDAITVVNGEADAALIVRLAPAEAGASHEDILRKLVKPVDGRTERRTLNGLAATHFVGTVRDEQGRAKGVRLTVVSGPNSRTYLLQYAAKDSAALQRAMAGLTEAESTFRRLGPAEKLAARPWVLRTVAYPRGGWQELARQSPLAVSAERQLRLLNGRYGETAQPRNGELVKVIR